MAESKLTTEPKLSWWWSRDEERFHGPAYSRADAIMEAWADDSEQGAFICQAAQGEWRTNIIEADHLQEWFDDANDEHADPDGDPPSTMIPPEKWEALVATLNRAIQTAVRAEGTLAWGFVSQTPSEWVDIPTAWKAAEDAALQLQGGSEQ